MTLLVVLKTAFLVQICISNSHNPPFFSKSYLSITTQTTFSQNRYPKLSAYKNDPNSKTNKKVVFSKHAVNTIQFESFRYLTKNNHFKYKIINELLSINNHTEVKNIHSFYKNLDSKKSLQFYDQFFNGPRFNFEVRKSTLSEMMKVNMLGLFSRESIKEGDLIGLYNGLHVIGGSDRKNNYPLSHHGWDYVYNGERDYIDAGLSGNFMRFMNHQDLPSVEARNVYVPSGYLRLIGKISDSEMKLLPEWIEIMVMYAKENIFAGEELFIHYGDDYWRDDREKSKLRQETFKMLSKTVSGLESEIWSLRSDNVDLKWRVEELEQRFSDLLKKLKTK